MKYSPEEIADIQKREKKAIEALKELELTPSATINIVNLGTVDPKLADSFTFKVTPFLNDLKYSKKSESIPSTNPEVNPQA